MVRTRAAWERSLGWTATLPALGILFLVGCGEQDLYKPPHSPYQITGRLPLESSPEDVDVMGNIAYVAGGQAGLLIVDISNPSNPTLRDVIDTKKYAEAIRIASVPSALGIVDIAFVVEGTEGITTYNVSDPDSVYSFEQGSTAVDGNGLFIDIPEDQDEPYVVYLAENAKGMRIFESDPRAPGLLRYNGVFSGTRGYAKAVAVEGGYAYVADDELGVAVLDVRVLELGKVRLVSWCDTPGNALGVAVHGGYAFVADGENGLVAMSINGGEPPIVVGQIPLAGICRAIEFRDDRVFLAAQDGGLHIVDVADPANPVLLGTVPTSYANGIGLAPNGTVVVSDRDEGMIVFTGGGAFRDQVAPASVANLTATAIDSSTVVLRWQAPGDDLFSGTASAYDIRYAVDGITNDSWDAATQVTGEPAPSRAGTLETYRLTGLLRSTYYYFALRTADEAGNWSGLSNVPSALTAAGNVPPVLSGGSVSPGAGHPGDLFVFSVTYTDPEGDTPTQGDIVINDEAHAMTYVSGEYGAGALFRYETILETGRYEYRFEFNDGHVDPVVTETYSGPFVGEVFVVGSPPGERGRDDDETQHTVVLTYQVEIATREVTQSDYEDLMGTNPSRHVGPNRPVERVTWFDAVAYCNALSAREDLTPAYAIDGEVVTWDQEADGWRLPTEAEWERGCRAGSGTAFANGEITGDISAEACIDTTTNLPDPVPDQIAWFCGNAGNATHDVGTKGVANAWGYYDMHGNVWEWCWDWYVGDLGSDTVLDPIGPPGGSQRAIRGGSWYHFARDCRSASRMPYWPGSKDDIVGFRVARTIPEGGR